MLVERKYYRQYDPKDNCFPKPPEKDVGAKECCEDTPNNLPCKTNNISLKADDLILIALIVVLLMEEEKDYITIGILAAVFLSEYLF